MRARSDEPGILPPGTQIWSRQDLQIPAGKYHLCAAPVLFDETHELRAERHKALEDIVAAALARRGLSLAHGEAAYGETSLSYSYATTAIVEGGCTHSLLLMFAPRVLPLQVCWEGRLWTGVTEQADIWPLVPTMFSALLRQFPVASPRAD